MRDEASHLECRMWFGTRNHDGYGVIRRDGSRHLTHRWVWRLMHGPIPDGMVVRHRCDNPACYRLDHLDLGSQADNIADRDARRRQHSVRGDAHCRTKISDADVAKIRQRFIDGERGCDIARDFPVHKVTIYRIIQGLTRIV